MIKKESEARKAVVTLCKYIVILVNGLALESRCLDLR